MAGDGDIRLGDIVRDTITGFEGVAVCIAEWLNMCRRITVQPQKLTKDGQVPDQHTFDEPDLAIIKRARAPKRELAKTGGPKPEPTRKG